MNTSFRERQALRQEAGVMFPLPLPSSDDLIADDEDHQLLELMTVSTEHVNAVYRMALSGKDARSSGIEAFEDKQGRPIDDELRQFIYRLMALENKAYQQGQRDRNRTVDRN